MLPGGPSCRGSESTPYVTEDSVYAALGELAQFSGGTEVVFDYANPPHAIEDARVRDLHYELAERVAESGEPFRCYFDARALRAARRRSLAACVADVPARRLSRNAYSPPEAGVGKNAS